MSILILLYQTVCAVEEAPPERLSAYERKRNRRIQKNRAHLNALPKGKNYPRELVPPKVAAPVAAPKVAAPKVAAFKVAAPAWKPKAYVSISESVHYQTLYTGGNINGTAWKTSMIERIESKEGAPPRRIQSIKLKNGVTLSHRGMRPWLKKVCARVLACVHCLLPPLPLSLPSQLARALSACDTCLTLAPTHIHTHRLPLHAEPCAGR